ncbi:MAG: hypothetical protein M1492_01565 [Gammaproteobacteria bacterium]|nr:hypothetical protein [Gammaproteobacteria bacterium]
MTPSSAANELLKSLPFPSGAVVIWPVTRNGQIALSVRLNSQYGDKAHIIPKKFAGYSIFVESNQPLSAQFMIDKINWQKTLIH